MGTMGNTALNFRERGLGISTYNLPTVASRVFEFLSARIAVCERAIDLYGSSRFSSLRCFDRRKPVSICCGRELAAN